MKLIIDIPDTAYELINKTGVTLDLHTVFHGKEKDKEMTFAIFDLVKALKNGITYEERPQGEWIIHDRECLKYGCNQCGNLTNINSNFCPNFGADMKGGTE